MNLTPHPSGFVAGYARQLGLIEKMKKTRYLLDDEGGIKIPSSFSARQIEIYVQFYKDKGMREVSKEEWYMAKKKWHSEPNQANAPEPSAR